MAENPFTQEAEWKGAAAAAITKLARSGEAFTVADLVAMIGPPPAPSLPATVFRAAHLGGVIEKDATAQVGTVWIGKVRVRQPRERSGPGRRKVDRQKVSEEVWSEAHDRAKAEG